MMSLTKNLFFTFIALGCTLGVFAQPQDHKYHFSIDLSTYQESHDRLAVELICPTLSGAETVYRVPKIVPGTYKKYDFGRFVKDFQAFDQQNKPLTVTRLDSNSWKISPANKLYKITYKVDDTFDAPAQENYVFQPAGSDFEKDVFLLNTHAFLGYFDGLKKAIYRLHVRKPKAFYGATALEPISHNDFADLYESNSYMNITDAPLLYCRPDTASLSLHGSKILVSVYSQNTEERYAPAVMKELETVLLSIEKFLGGELPVRKYAFLVYLSGSLPVNGMQGALEHSQSSLYYLVDGGNAHAVAREIRDVGAHEFFHIVTPLTLHSEEIADFDYNTPKMSKHLWLYEGVTEYNSLYVQLVSRLISQKDFFNSMKLKMSMSEQLFDDSLSFTQLSKNVLDEYADQYSNVYEKGALMAWCLDLQIRHYTYGQMGLQRVISELAKKYGANKPFRDDELISEIVALTNPAVGEFFHKYVEGGSPLPFTESLAFAGYDFQKEVKKKEPSLGKISLEYKGNREVLVSYIGNMNDFGRSMGWQVGDVLLELQGKPVNTDNIETLLADYRTNTKDGQLVKVKVARLDNKGEKKTITLKAKAQLQESTERYRITPMLKPTPAQLKVREAWLKGL